MKNVFFGLAVMVLTLIASSSAQAQSELAEETHGKGAGNVEFAFSYSSEEFEAEVDGVEQESETTDTMVIRVGYGYFFFDGFEAKALFTLFADFPDAEGSEDDGYYLLELRLAYHFLNSSRFVPYLGAKVGNYESFDDEIESAIEYGAFVGVDYMINANVSIFTELTYSVLTVDGEFDGGPEFEADITTVNLFIGAKYYF